MIDYISGMAVANSTPNKKAGLSWIVFGHRGAAGLEPENTLRGIRKALSLRVHGIEIDVHRCENRLVVIHDPRLNRTTNGRGHVAETSFRDIRRLDAGLGERIPTLEEVLLLVKKRALINIELKGKDVAELTARLLENFIKSQGLPSSRFLVSSFDHRQLNAFHYRLPSVPIGVLAATGKLTEAFITAEKLNAASLHLSTRQARPATLTRAKRMGFRVYVYTVNNPERTRKLQALGADGIFTDFPDRMMRLK